MDTTKPILITVQLTIQAPIERVWECFTNPSDIVHWYTASPDWHTPKAENDLQVGGRFSFRMEAKDGSMGFDFCGMYDEVVLNKKIHYILDDDRTVSLVFSSIEKNLTEVVEEFEAENENTPELQRQGWQAILDNFKKYVEAK